MACNDYIILESCIYRVLKKHFAGKTYYPLLLDFFHEVSPSMHLIGSCMKAAKSPHFHHDCMCSGRPAHDAAVADTRRAIVRATSVRPWDRHMRMVLTSACEAQTTHQTAHGQLLDITTAPIGTVDLSKYTEETYIRIVTFKTAFYSFYLPVVCGLLVGGVTSQEAFGAAKAICIKMGQYFQAGCRKTRCALCQLCAKSLCVLL